MNKQADIRSFSRQAPLNAQIQNVSSYSIDFEISPSISSAAWDLNAALFDLEPLERAASRLSLEKLSKGEGGSRLSASLHLDYETQIIKRFIDESELNLSVNPADGSLIKQLTYRPGDSASDCWEDIVKTSLSEVVIRLSPHVHELLSCLKGKELLMGVFSAWPADLSSALLNKFEISGYFTAQVSKHELAQSRTKPDLDLWPFLIERLNNNLPEDKPACQPRSLLVFSNSPSIAISASSLGIDVVICERNLDLLINKLEIVRVQAPHPKQIVPEHGTINCVRSWGRIKQPYFAGETPGGLVQ